MVIKTHTFFYYCLHIFNNLSFLWLWIGQTIYPRESKKYWFSVGGWGTSSLKYVVTFGTSEGNTGLLFLSVNQETWNYPAYNAATMWGYCVIFGNIAVRIMKEVGVERGGGETNVQCASFRSQRGVRDSISGLGSALTTLAVPRPPSYQPQHKQSRCFRRTTWALLPVGPFWHQSVLGEVTTEVILYPSLASYNILGNLWT